jgi:hypothetical protein
MRHLAPLALLAIAACSDDPLCDQTCEATSKTFGLTDRTLHDARSKDFVSDGVTYTLVRLEYGDTPECDEWDEEDCWYSTYCGFVVDGVDYPLEVDWVAEADALFDPELYCEDGEIEGCELPGQLLPILEDEDFEDWVYDTDPEADKLVDCFADYW